MTAAGEREDTPKKRICFVVQRYGTEVNGGAELLTRQLAERLTDRYEVHVLTSTAQDYQTWEDYYPEEETRLNGVCVHRFRPEHPRDAQAFAEIEYTFMQGELPPEREQEWVDKQGPLVPALIRYIRAHRKDFSVFLFCTYLYYPTVMGVPEVREKAIVLPFAHDEPYLNMHIYEQNVFRAPQAFMFLTEEERALVRRKFRNYDIPCTIGGAGVDIPDHVSGQAFREKYHLGRYLIYVGRIDEGKNCEELWNFWDRYKRQTAEDEKLRDLKLVLIGKAEIPVPQREDILSLGFVSEEDKFNGIAGAEALVLPSKFESLSIVVLEAFGVRVPVIVNGACAVLKAHCEKSGGGFWYDGYSDFAEAVTAICTDPSLRTEKGEKGYRYLRRNYQWAIIIRKLDMMIQYVISLSAAGIHRTRTGNEDE